MDYLDLLNDSIGDCFEDYFIKEKIEENEEEEYYEYDCKE